MALRGSGERGSGGGGSGRDGDRRGGRFSAGGKRPAKLPPYEGPRVVLGAQAVREAIRVHGDALIRVLVEKKKSPRLDALARFAADRGAPVERVQPSVIDRLARGTRHQGVAALAPDLVVGGLDDLPIDDDALLILLDGITDPHNFGATLRCAVALGATAVVWGEHHAAPLSAATFRASAGAVEHARLFQVASLRAAVEHLVEQGVTTVALESSASEELGEFELTGPAAIVVGAEDAGVARGVRKVCSARARLPMTGAIDSLNASVAAGLALYEARRQRQSKNLMVTSQYPSTLV
jgi:23S rRNA (guanosine2251-2'-O)-methyltransferase